MANPAHDSRALPPVNLSRQKNHRFLKENTFHTLERDAAHIVTIPPLIPPLKA
jgi:hypothetical protein